MQILVLLGMYFDAVVVFVTSQILLFRLALAILCFLDHFLPSLLGQKWYLGNDSILRVKKMYEKLIYRVRMYNLINMRQPQILFN